MSKLEENLEKNEHISDKFKKIARETFKEMLDMLGREKFKKWIKIQTISKDVQSLIYEWADENEMYKIGRAGEYDNIENKIRIAKGKNNNKIQIKGVVKHENFHFFTRYGWLKMSSTFLNEGVTEYLKHLCEQDEKKYNYEENVEVVAFIRDLVGDSIIRTYLEGKGKYFVNDLHDILKEDIESEQEREQVIYDFLDQLDERHMQVYSMQYSYLENDYEGEERLSGDVSQKINEYLEKIILCKFRQMAKSRSFNRNGVFDETLAREMIAEKLQKVRFVGDEYEFMSKTEMAKNIRDRLMDGIISDVARNYNLKAFTLYECEFQKKFQERFGEEKYPINDVFNDIFDKDRKLSTIEFADYISKLVYDFNIPSDKLGKLCETYAFKNYQNIEKVGQVYELIASNIPRNYATFNLLSKNATSAESKFRKIGDSEYVEQRDGKFFYLKINDDGTVFEESDLTKVKDIFKIEDNLDSIKLTNREDDYRELGVLDEKKFQQIEMVHQLTNQIIYGKEINIEHITKDMNTLIEDLQFLRKILETSVHKRTRLQVIDWINLLTKDEIEQVSNEIYDVAIMQTGINEIEQEQEIIEYYKNLNDYDHRTDKDI